MEGVYSEFNLEPQDQQRHQPEKYPNLLDGHAYGVLVRKDGVRLACGSWVFLMDGQTDAWLEFYIPMGTLSENDPRVGAFPFSDEGSSEAWRRPLDEQLVQIAERVYAVAKFQWAMIGFEMGPLDVKQLNRKREPPAERWGSYLMERDHRLVWYPPTRYDPTFTVGE